MAGRIAIRVGLIGLLVLIGYLYVIGEGDDERPSASGASEGQTFANQAVERFVPRAGDLAVRQDQVGVDLKPGYEAELEIESAKSPKPIPIPKDQLTVNQPLFEYFFKPGKGKELERFEPGDVCVTALITDLTQEGADPQRVTWCFKVA